MRSDGLAVRRVEPFSANSPNSGASPTTRSGMALLHLLMIRPLYCIRLSIWRHFQNRPPIVLILFRWRYGALLLPLAQPFSLALLLKPLLA
jgi:hypothetical protein